MILVAFLAREAIGKVVRGGGDPLELVEVEPFGTRGEYPLG